MRVLLAHNYYRQRAGEAVAFEAERDLLLENGHEISTYTLDNADIDKLSRPAVSVGSIWSRSTYRELADLIRRKKIQVAHFHNTFPLLSPSAYYAAGRAGAAVVQSIHNYRLACVNGVFFRSGRICTDCKERNLAWPGIVHACYQGSRAASTVVATMLAGHRLAGTWRNHVDRYILLSEFQLDILSGVLPSERTVVKPNFIEPDPGPGTGAGGYAIFVGRLSPEKGIRTLLDAWRSMRYPSIPLKIVGDGPLVNDVRSAAHADPAIEYLGRRAHDEVLELLGYASLLVFPSECFEGIGLTILEAYSRGTPVLAANIGAHSQVVVPGRTGALFRVGDAVDLGVQVKALLKNEPYLRTLRTSVRDEFLDKYTGRRNIAILSSIYDEAIKQRAQRIGQ